MKIFTSFIIKSNFLKAIISALPSIRKSFFNISIISLLFLAACSDKSCIEANDFGEYETEYLSISPTLSNANCTFTLQKPLEAANGVAEDQYYTPSSSFQLMQDSNDFEAFMEIISNEYRNLLSQGSENLDQNKYDNFFTIFGGELQNYIVGEGKITGDNKYKVDYRDFLTIDINQQDRVLIKKFDDQTIKILNEQLTDRDEMLRFLLGESISECEKGNHYCQFLPDILYSYKWSPKKDDKGKYLGCNMKADGITEPKDVSYMTKVGDNSKKLKIKYPPLDIFLQCVEKAVEKCNNDKISNLNKKAAKYTSNDKISRSYPPASTSKYNPDVNDSLIITPESKIYIKALGEIILGGSVSYPNMFIDSFLSSGGTSLKFQNHKSQKKYLSDVLNLSIESNWQNNIKDIYHISDKSDKNSLKNSYNALSRLVIYVGDSISGSNKEIEFKDQDQQKKLIEDTSKTKPIVNYYINKSDDNDIKIVNLNIPLNEKTNKVEIGTKLRTFMMSDLVKDSAIKISINDKKIDCIQDTKKNLCYIDDIILKKQDILKIEFEKDGTSFPAMSAMIEDPRKELFSIEPSSKKFFISDQIEISGLYNISSSSNCNKYKIINNYDIYDDVIEKEGDISPNKKLYLRKGQRVLLFENCNSSKLKELKITLEHERPAFICQKRIDNFEINNPFCISDNRKYCVNNFHDSCISGGSNHCNINNDAVEESESDVLNQLMQDCRMHISYDKENKLNLNKCTNIISEKCKSKSDIDKCQANCEACMKNTFKFDNLPKSSINYNEKEIDICYDLEEYTGKVEELNYIKDNVSHNNNVKNIENIIAKGGQYKRAKELSFNGIYGNFVNNGKFLLDINPDDSNQYFGSLNLLRSDILNFLIVNNENLDLDDSGNFIDIINSPALFETNFDHDAAIGQGNGYWIEFDGIDKIYKNGEMLESYLCYFKDEETTTPSCLTLETRNNILQSLNPEKLIAISSLQYSDKDDEYRNMCKSVTDYNSNFGYYFNKFGKLQEMNKSDMPYCPNIQEIPDNKYQTRKYYDNEENQINDSKYYQIYFSIIDDQENNCIIYNDTPNSSHANCNPNKHYKNQSSNGKKECNGIKVENPYYTGCEKDDDYLISNPYFNRPSIHKGFTYEKDGQSITRTYTHYCPINCKLYVDNSESLDHNQCSSKISKDKIHTGNPSNFFGSKYLCASNCSIPSKVSDKNSADNFCQDSDPSASTCSKAQYYCINKLMDNSGKYNLEVKVKDSSEFHGFMYSMLAPIIDFIYGSPETCIEGKELFTQEGDYLGICKEINIVKTHTDISGQRQFDFRDRAKEYVIINGDNSDYIIKYEKPQGKIVCKQGNLVNQAVECGFGINQGVVEIRNLFDISTANLGYIRENHIHQYGERVAHPEKGYILRKDSMAKKVYQNMVNNELFKNLLKILMVVALSFYGGSYLMGMSEFSRTEIMSRIIRIAVISLFLSPNGWIWFQNIFVNFFEKGGDYLTLLMISAFESDELIKQSLNNNYFDPSILFSSFDKIISLFSLTMFYKITALFFTGITGWLYMLLIYWAIMRYFIIVFQVVTLYLSAKLFLNLTFLLAPILLLFILFEQTKDTLNKWLKQMASFVLQQILILFTFSLFNSILYYLIKSVLAYKICWGTVLSLDILVKISLFKWWTIAGDYSPTLISILILFFMVLLMSDFIDSASQVAERIVDGVTIDNVQTSMENMRRQMFKSINLASSQIIKKTGAEKYIGKYGIRDFAKKQILNYGKGAEEERQNKLKSERESNALRKKMNKAADKAVAEFKVNSIAKGEKLFLDDKDGEGLKTNKMERIEKIKEIRQNDMLRAVKDYNKEKGKILSDKEAMSELNKLKNPNHNNANWSHDSISSLLLSKINRRKIDINKHIEQSDLDSADIKRAYQKLKKDGLTSEEIKEKLENPIAELKKLNKRSEVSAKNLEVRLKIQEDKGKRSEESEDRDMRNTAINSWKSWTNPIRIKYEAGYYRTNVRNAGVNIPIESFKYVRTKIDNSVGGRISASGKLGYQGIKNVKKVKPSKLPKLGYQGIKLGSQGIADAMTSVKDSRKTQERIEAEQYLQKKGQIKAERNHDLGLFTDYASTAGYITARIKKKFPILQTVGLRQEWNPEEKKLVLELETRIKERGGVENLQKRINQIATHYKQNENEVKKLIGEKLFNKLKNGEGIEEVAKEFLIGDNKKVPDWRKEIDFSDFNPYLGSDGKRSDSGF
jgi:type IV secretory pathway VirB6-like protein